MDTDKWPIIKAKHFTPYTSSRRLVRLIVIHTAETSEMGNSAESIANYFQTTDKQASSHIAVDNNSIVQCVMDNDIAWAAPGANSDGIQIELAGRASQTQAEWMDDYSKAVLENAANATAQYCLKYAIAPRHLSNEQLADKALIGIVGHVQVSEVFKKSTHTDPGPEFPWNYFIERVKYYAAERRKS